MSAQPASLVESQARNLRVQQLALAMACTVKAAEAVSVAEPLDEDAALAVKNFTQAALAATQAWMTVTRQGERR